jgi:hypothetical protein
VLSQVWMNVAGLTTGLFPQSYTAAGRPAAPFRGISSWLKSCLASSAGHLVAYSTAVPATPHAASLSYPRGAAVTQLVVVPFAAGQHAAHGVVEQVGRIAPDEVSDQARRGVVGHGQPG